MLPQISSEQSNIIKSLKHGYNVCVDSVAGSGKTTTVLYCAQFFSDRKLLLLTYNAKLKMETRVKKDKLGYKNLDVHSYHSFGYKYFNHLCNTDAGIIDTITHNTQRLLPFKYDIIILDEVQDMTTIYYHFILKIIKDNDTNIENQQLCVLGDKFQSIYTFNGSDARYIIYASDIFKSNTRKWKMHKLSISYRLTNKMAQFLNFCVIKTNRINTIKDNNVNVKYIICDAFGNKDLRIFNELTNCLSLYSCEDIFILAPTVKKNGVHESPIKLLANRLTEKNIPIFVASSDDDKLDEDILNGKLVFSTFHQVKGLERKIVFIFNFDSSYLKFYNKTCNPEICPNELYVATTRATEQLIVIHHFENDYLPFLEIDELKHHTSFMQDYEISENYTNK